MRRINGSARNGHFGDSLEATGKGHDGHVNEPRPQRRLAAILAADVAGFSRLTGSDEEGTLARFRTLRREVIGPAIERHGGRLVKTAGDGMIVEFASVVEAVRCALALQQELVGRQEALARDERIELRIGVHLGDVVAEEDDLLGDGVNVAARLEALSTPRGIRLSRAALEQVDGKLEVAFRSLGPQRLKNIARPVEVFALDFAERLSEGQEATLNQVIAYCRTDEGVRLAYARVGEGPPLLKTGNWLSHLQYEWESPIWRHLLLRLAERFTLWRYDARGQGMSDWEVPAISPAGWLHDLETVADAIGLERFPLFAMSQGCAAAIAYAAKHPERVTRLVLLGGYAVGWNAGARAEEESEAGRAMVALMRHGWGRPEPTFRQLFTSMFIPGATPEQAAAFNELQRRTTSADCAAHFMQAVGDIDVREACRRVACPTLVLHVRGDARIPFAVGREMAEAIPGARFVALEGSNHIPLEGDPGTDRLFEELDLFLADGAKA